jgi:hypothetical protein
LACSSLPASAAWSNEYYISTTSGDVRTDHFVLGWRIASSVRQTDFSRNVRREFGEPGAPNWKFLNGRVYFPPLFEDGSMGGAVEACDLLMTMFNEFDLPEPQRRDWLARALALLQGGDGRAMYGALQAAWNRLEDRKEKGG